MKNLKEITYNLYGYDREPINTVHMSVEDIFNALLDRATITLGDVLTILVSLPRYKWDFIAMECLEDFAYANRDEDWDDFDSRFPDDPVSSGIWINGQRYFMHYSNGDYWSYKYDGTWWA